MEYFKKMKGVTTSPPRVSFIEMLWSWIGAFAGISAVAYIHYDLFKGSDFVMIIGSFGASAVLIYGAIRSPLAQPRNLLGGHLISAFIGVTAYKLLPDQMWLASALSVSTSILVMHATKTLHPPGGATALIAVTGSQQIHDLGYFYVVMPAGIGAFILLTVALVINNISKNRRYPEYWL
jgi:CBS-domain-containing membrane protein